MSRAALAPSLFLAAAALACAPGMPGGDAGPDAFEDHTKPAMSSRDEVLAWAREGVGGGSALKFVVTSFSDESARELRYYDGSFYTLHDEWFWFRLMNNQRVAGVEMEPHPGSFATIAEIVAWAREQTSLPLDLRFVGDRLYSPAFYGLALDTTPRVLGLGTVIHVPARSEPEARAEVWAFELEFQDDLTHADLSVFFTALDDTLPAGIAGEVRWLVRSPAQEALAKDMEARALAFHDRILRYDEIVVPGDVEVYSEGIVAGRLKAVRLGEPGLEDSRSTDVLALGFVPDFLPPASGLLTAVPQTPLAHINVLARNRGIPNAYRGGLLDDANLDQLARVRAPVVLLAERSPVPRVLLHAISEQDFATWRSLSQPPTLELTPVETGALPYALDLATLSFEDLSELRPVIGGKSAGLLGLLAPGDVVTPDFPLALTVRAYHEHLLPLRPRIAAALAHSEMERSARARFLVLEGQAAYEARFATAEDRLYLEQLRARPDVGPLLGLIDDGGVRALIEAGPMAAEALSAIADSLFAQFGHLHPSQGLRFRSSSNVEDIEGFNGAGLYESYSGFLFPDLAGEPGRDVETAIKRVWASYWGAEAFEERRLSRVSHLAGLMGVLVHARFEDESEVSNAVFTYTLLPPGLADEGELVVNVQRGALSVTNPPPGSSALPEVDVVRLKRGALAPVIERVASSTEVPAGQVVLDEQKLLELFFSAKAVSEAWIAVENQGVLSAQRRRALVLDFELREMAAGWPAVASGAPYGQRLVIKQARSLEPGTAHLPSTVRALPFPKDVLARARLIERIHCQAPALDLTIADAYTDPLLPPDLGHAQDPFTAFVTLDVKEALPSLGLAAGRRVSFVHPGFLHATHPGLSPETYALDVAIDPARPEGQTLSGLTVTPEGSWTLARGETSETGEGVLCERTPLFTTPDDFLRALLP